MPETDYTPFPSGWRPDHEKVLLEYIKLDDARTLEEQRQNIEKEGLVTPQDYISTLVWNYKRNALVTDHMPVAEEGIDIDKAKEFIMNFVRDKELRKNNEDNTDGQTLSRAAEM